MPEPGDDDAQVEATNEVDGEGVAQNGLGEGADAAARSGAVRSGKSRPTHNPHFPCVYLVIFKSSPPTEKYSPLVSRMDAGVGTHPHGFPREMLAALKAVWYCLHLPKDFIDVAVLPAQFMPKLRLLESPHKIILVPTFLASRLPDAIRPLAILHDAQEDGATIEEISARLQPPLGTISFDKLSQKTLDTHWQQIADLATLTDSNAQPLALPSNVLLEPDGLIYQRMLRLFGSVSTDLLDQHKLQDFKNLDDVQRHTSTVRLFCKIDTFARIAEREIAEPTEPSHEILDEEWTRAVGKLRFHVTLVIPGVTRKYVRALYGDAASRWKDFPSVFEKNISLPWDAFQSSEETSDALLAEESVLRVLLAHRSIARDGIGFRCASATNADFSLVSDLERSATARTEKPKKMWRMLETLGERSSQIIGSLALQSLRRASHLCVFSGFPIGLGILPGQSDPLCLCLPISYRPIVPLTRCLQYELNSPNIYYPAAGCRVLIAECLKPDDKIWPLSKVAWDAVEKISHKARVEVRRVEIKSLKDLCNTLEQGPFDVLIVSAHGFYVNNIAGFWIRDERCLEIPSANVPPVVIMSSCYSAPRGQTTVSVADLLLRWGAKAVLAAQIPIDVRRTSHLMTRLFVYWAEAVSGSKDFPDLAELWRHVCASNAVVDIGRISNNFEDWLMRSGALEEFMLRQSVGKLKTGNVHAQTRKILLDMVRADNPKLRSAFEQSLQERSYFPETFFYHWIGWPEHVRFKYRIPEIEREMINIDTSVMSDS